MRNNKLINLTLTALFAALITVGAYIRIPMGILPNTMQVFFVLLSGMILGGKYAFCSVLLYMIMGLIGLPVFTDGGGFSYILNPKFGYIIGFLLAALITGYLSVDKRKNVFVSGIIGIFAIYAFGLSYLYMISRFYLKNSLSVPYLIVNCFLIFLPSDIISSILSSFISIRIKKAIKKAGNI